MAARACVCVCVCTSLAHEIRGSQPFQLLKLACAQSEEGIPTFVSRGVWHLHPTTLNEAVDASGKQDLISLVYLPSDQPVGPLWHWSNQH